MYVNGLWLADCHLSRKCAILKLTTFQFMNSLGLVYTCIPVNSRFGNGLTLATNSPICESIFHRYVCAPPLLAWESEWDILVPHFFTNVEILGQCVQQNTNEPIGCVFREEDSQIRPDSKYFLFPVLLHCTKVGSVGQE